MYNTIEDVMLKYFDCEGMWTGHELGLIKAAMQEWASLQTPSNDQEKLWDEVEDIFDKHTAPTGGGYEADYTSKGGFISDLKEKYLLMPLPNKPNL